MFAVTNNNQWLQYKSFLFSGGEVSVKLTPEMTSFTPNLNDSFKITAHVFNSNQLLEVVFLVDAIRQTYGDVSIELFIPYLPYARQDRVCAPGESFSLKVFADILNSLHLERVMVADVHSPVAFNLIQNLSSIPQEDLVKNIDPKYLVNTVLVSPDKGAAKKIDNVARTLKLPVVRADKVRDPNTGKITGTIIENKEVFKNCNLLVVDDICDGGRTFVELAKVASDYYTGKFYLYVTHGIFSKGFVELEDWYDHIFVAYPFPGVINHPSLTVTGGY